MEPKQYDLSDDAMEKYINNINNLDTLLEKHFPPTEWIVDKLIPEQAVVLLSAHPASLKTWLALDWSIRVAKGERFLDRFDTNQAGVLIMDAESGERQLQKHFKILGATENLPIYYKVCNRERIDKKFATSLLVECKVKDIKLVIFDSLTRFHDVDENSSRDMSGVFESFTTLKNHGVTCLIICHSRKSGNNSNQQVNARNQAESIRGSSDILAACDLHIAINRGDNNVVRIEQTKNRFDEELKPFTARFVKDSPDKSHWEFREVLDTNEDKRERLRGLVYESIVNQPGLNQKQLYDIALEIGFKGGDKKFRRMLRELVLDELVYEKSGSRTEKLYYAVDSSDDGGRQNG